MPEYQGMLYSTSFLEKAGFGKKDEICNECFECIWFDGNNDTGFQCVGAKKACHEYVAIKNMMKE